MTKSEFLTNARMAGVEVASMLARACGVPLAQVQLWIRTA